MSIRKKTLLIIFLTFSSLFLLLYVSSQAILLASYTSLETTFVERNLRRGRLALEKEIVNVETFAEDWASWDDTYDFVQTGDEEYIAANLVEGTYATIPVNLIAFVNTRGELVYGKSYFPDQGLQPISEEIKQQLTPDGLLFTETQALRRVTGILQISPHPMIIAALPILTSLDEGPVQGMMVFGRFIDAAQVDQLSDLTQVDVSIYNFDAAAVPTTVRNLALQKANDPYAQPIDMNLIAGYTWINDVYDHPALVLKITILRSIYLQGIISIQYFMAAILIVGLVIGVMIMLLLERTIIAPLTYVSQSVTAIGLIQDTKKRILRQGNDELAQLVDAVNKMLERLDQSQRSVRESEERLQILVSNAPVLLFVLNESGEFMFAEGRGVSDARTLVGRSAMTVFGFLPEARRANVERIMVTSATFGDHIYEMRYTTLFTSQNNLLRTVGVATDITEREIARTAEREQRMLAEALRDTAEVLTGTLKLDEVVERISGSVGKVVPHDAAMMMLIENGVATLVRSREDTAHRLHSLENQKSIETIPWLRHLIETREPLIIDDMRNRREMSLLPGVLWAQSFVAIPVYLDEQVVGVLCLYHEVAGAFTPTHIQRLEMFAGQAALAIRNARFYETERKQRELAQMLQKTAEMLSSSNDLEDALNGTGHWFRFVVPYDQFSLILSTEHYQQLTDNDEIVEHSRRLYPCDDFDRLREAMRDQTVIMLNDIREQPFWRSVPGLRPQIRSWIGIPLPVRNRVVGMITFGRTRVEPFSHYHIQVIMAFVQQIVLTVENLTILAELEVRLKELREAQSQLVRMTRLSTAGEIAAGVAHQISNPLTTVVAEAHLALQNLTPEDVNHESLIAIQAAAQRAGNVVGRLLDLTRNPPYVMTSLDLNDSIQNAVALVQVQIVPHFARLELDLAPDLPMINGSMQHLDDVWINLLLNARDALDPLKENVIKITSRFNNVRRVIQVTIEDTGSGIDEDNLPRVFDSLFTTKQHGTGLGLAICREIVEYHGGTIEIMSPNHQGAVVEICFTVQQVVMAKKEYTGSPL